MQSGGSRRAPAPALALALAVAVAVAPRDSAQAETKGEVANSRSRGSALAAGGRPGGATVHDVVLTREVLSRDEYSPPRSFRTSHRPTGLRRQRVWLDCRPAKCNSAAGSLRRRGPQCDRYGRRVFALGARQQGG